MGTTATNWSSIKAEAFFFIDGSFDSKAADNVINIATPASDGKKRKVLIVDDEQVIADTLVEILNDSGFQATAFYDGATALEHIRELCPDTLISDVIMPGMNGIEIAKAVKKFCPATRIFLFSGQATTVDLVERAKKEGHPFELLAKPLHPEDLLKKLGQE